MQAVSALDKRSKRHDYPQIGELRLPYAECVTENDQLVKDRGRFIDAPYRELRIPVSGHGVQNQAVADRHAALLEFLSEKFQR